MRTLIALLLLLCATGEANEPSLGVQLQELSLDYAQYATGSRDPLVATPKERLNLTLNMSLLRYGYINNTVHSMTDQSQFRMVGWQYQMGVHVGKWADVYFEHYSRHLLDTVPPFGYPMENLVGVKLYLYRR